MIINHPYTTRTIPQKDGRFHVVFGWDDGTQFVVSYEPSRYFKTLAGAQRASAKWTARNALGGF